MIEAVEPEVVLSRFWLELREAGDLSWIPALLPADRKLGLLDLFPLAPVVMAQLSTPVDQLRTLDALARAYLRAAGLHVSED